MIGMKRIRIKDLRLKYILGEILLIFIGINLAIWFNNWNTSKAVAKNKSIALEKINGEIHNNLQELLKSRAENKRIPDFIERYNTIFTEDSGVLIMTIEEMRVFQEDYSGFFKILDSARVEGDRYNIPGIPI